MLNVPASFPAVPVIVGAIIAVVGWPLTAWFAYRLGLRSHRVRMEWDAQQAKKSVHRKFIESANRFRENVSISEHRDTWVDFFKDNAAQLVSDYETIRGDLRWSEKKRMDEAMNSIRRFASMNRE